MNTNKKGFAIASLIVGILSMTICCIGGSLLGIIGLIFGIVSLCRHENGKGIAIGGMITSCIGMLIGVVMIAIFGSVALKSTVTKDEISRELPVANVKDVFRGNHFQVADESMIYFEKDGTFVWYQSDDDHDDNYYTGTYDSYYGQEAVEYITESMTEYGVTQEEMDDYFARNAGDEVYIEANFCLLILHNEELVADSEKQILSNDNPYMGFYVDGYYDCANMNRGEYSAFVLQE